MNIVYFAARFPVNWYLGISLVCCGIVMAASAACNNYASLATVRVLLAIVESVIVPSLSLVTMKWYTRLESTKRFGIWYCGVGLGQMLGGLLSFGSYRYHSLWTLMLTVRTCNYFDMQGSNMYGTPHWRIGEACSSPWVSWICL